jgi:hypothetical protein
MPWCGAGQCSSAVVLCGVALCRGAVPCGVVLGSAVVFWRVVLCSGVSVVSAYSGVVHIYSGMVQCNAVV